MKKNMNNYNQILSIILLASLILMGLTIFVMDVTAEITRPEHLEYKSQMYQEKLTIPAQEFKTIDLEFLGGKKLEFIFKLYVQEELPIDVWFLNDENYTKFIKGSEYNFFIDGSEEQVVFVTKIVSFTEYDTYKLILVNYNETKPVNVEIIYEGRVYDDYSSEKSSKDSLETSLFYPFLVALIILIIITISLSVKIRRNGRENSNNSKKSSKKNSKNKKKNKSKQKAKGRTS